MSAHKIKEISIYALHIPENRHMPLRPDAVERLAESINSIGLLQPICVQPDANHDTYRLVAGRHRLEALKRLKWEMIPATVLGGLDALEVEAAELSENLLRMDLTATQKSMHYARLMEIAEIKHKMRGGAVETEDGDVPAKLAGVSPNAKHANSAVAVAQETNRSARSVERDASRVRNIPQIAEVVNTSLDEGTELDALAKLSHDIQAEIIRRAKEGESVSARVELKKHERAEKERLLGQKQRDLPTGKYSVILADPPWAFKAYSQNGMDRSPENHYPTMSIEDIMDMPIGDLSERNSVLFMWATAPLLPEAINILKVWGFTYKTHLVWVKNKMGLGYWARNQHELLLIGTRGDVIAPAPGSQFPSVITAAVAEHSKKPEDFYRIIESYFPSVSKVELFARNNRHGWASWGFEAPEEAPEPAEDHDSWDAPVAEEPEKNDVSDFDDIFGE